MIEYSIYFAVFLVAILVFEAVASAYALGRDRNRAINRRLTLLQSVPENSAVLSRLLAERGIDGTSTAVSLWNWLRNLWTLSGLTITPIRFTLLTTGGAAVATAVVSVLFSNFYLILAVFVGLTAALPFLVLRRLRTQRVRRFTGQLPNALDVIVRSLTAGHPVSSAIGLVAREMPDPMGSEFGIVSDELTFGQDVETAMTNLFERVGADELRLLVTTISIQRSTGGNLAEVLQNLSGVIRERIHMRARIRALSAEGRFTAWIMAFFPFVMYFVISFLSPNYFDTFWNSPFVVPVLVLCSFLLVLGNYVLFKMVNFDF
jgi:tight adherence protein B